MSKVKVCSKCGIEKPIDEFFNNKTKKDGKGTRCKKCSLIDKRKYYIKNQEDIIQKRREYRAKNKGVPISDERKLYQKEWRKDNAKQCNENYKKRYKSFGGKLKMLYKAMRTRSIDRGHSIPSFSFEEFTVWAFENGYKELYDDWKNDNYNKWTAPSPDRLDNSKGYMFSNMRLVTFYVNNKDA